MELTITRWNQPEPPTEDELRLLYREEGLTPYAWGNDPGDFYAPHSHSYDKVLYVVSGSITWFLPQAVSAASPSGQQIDAFPGDRIDLPRGTVHAALVGPHGVVCLEAHATVSAG